MWLSLILSCWGAIKVLKPQPTKNKVGSSLSWLPLPSFGAVSLDLCWPRAITCSEQFFCLIFFVLPLVAKHRKASHKGKLAPWLRMGVALPGLVGAPFYICPLRPNEKQRVKSYFFFLLFFEEGELSSPASFHVAGILIARDACSPAAQGAK